MTEQALPLWRRILMAIFGIRRPPHRQGPAGRSTEK